MKNGSKKIESPKTDVDTEQQKQLHCALSQFEAVCGAGFNSKQSLQSSAVSSITLVTPIHFAQHRE